MSCEWELGIALDSLRGIRDHLGLRWDLVVFLKLRQVSWGISQVSKRESSLLSISKGDLGISLESLHGNEALSRDEGPS